MQQCFISLALLISFLLTPTAPGRAAEKAPSPEQERFFEARIRPLLAEHCYACHGPNKQKAGLRLDTRAGVLQGGEFGTPPVVAGQPEKSLLLRAVSYQDKTLKRPSR